MDRNSRFLLLLDGPSPALPELQISYSPAQLAREREKYALVCRRNCFDPKLEALREGVHNLFDQDLRRRSPRRDAKRRDSAKEIPFDVRCVRACSRSARQPLSAAANSRN